MKELFEDLDLSKGIFWIKDPDNISSSNLYFTVPCDVLGEPTFTDGLNLTAKCGTTFNHERTWKQLPNSITEGKTYNYYPRGRVEINHGKAIIYANPNIVNDELKEWCKDKFNLYPYNGIKSIRMVADGSEHYKCYLDN